MVSCIFIACCSLFVYFCNTYIFFNEYLDLYNAKYKYSHYTKYACTLYIFYKILFTYLCIIQNI